jgi:hypothetical protein
MSVFETGLNTIIRSIGETVTYLGDGSLNDSLKAVFSNEHVMIDPETNQKITNNQPHLLVCLSDLPETPQLGSLFTVRAQNYSVGYLEQDGEGGARVYLREVLS